MPHVRIVYEPSMYAEIFTRVLEALKNVELVHDSLAGVDVIVIPLDDESRPRVDLLPDLPPDTKLVALSAWGECGMILMPGEKDWEEVRPFGLGHLFVEVLAGRERAMGNSTTHHDALMDSTHA